MSSGGAEVGIRGISKGEMKPVTLDTVGSPEYFAFLDVAPLRENHPTNGDLVVAPLLKDRDHFARQQCCAGGIATRA